MRFVGDPVACVVAETAMQAKEAAEAVELDIEPLPAVTLASEAVKPGAPLVYDDVPGNIALDYHYGDADKVAAAFARAAHVTRLTLVNTRLVVNAMEPRAAVAAYDAANERFTFHAGCQGVFGLRAQLADILGVAPRQGARADRQCRRLVRHEGAGLSGIYLPPARRPRARAAGEMDRRALRQAFSPTATAATTRCVAELALDADGHFLAHAADRLRQYRRLSSAPWRRCRRPSIRSRTSSASTARR